MRFAKKGDRLILVGRWDRTGAFYSRPVLVESWGEKQGTLRCEATGDMLRHSFATVDHHGEEYFSPAMYANGRASAIRRIYVDGVDVDAVTVQTARDYKAEELRNNRRRVRRDRGAFTVGILADVVATEPSSIGNPYAWALEDVVDLLS